MALQKQISKITEASTQNLHSETKYYYEFENSVQPKHICSSCFDKITQIKRHTESRIHTQYYLSFATIDVKSQNTQLTVKFEVWNSGFSVTIDNTYSKSILQPILQEINKDHKIIS